LRRPAAPAHSLAATAFRAVSATNRRDNHRIDRETA
jgi:hypothetical protein